MLLPLAAKAILYSHEHNNNSYASSSLTKIEDHKNHEIQVIVVSLPFHIDTNLTWGLTKAFEYENGPTPSSTLSLPPLDLPKC
ncbi:hypothetical protein RJT34_07856 [Clitoria ternatea]|uniref:Uncharacterized protein n=1 Tax=Clitoria ternatea TaxID=43366 RepID=A0AAN9K3S3_CLITE